MCPARSQTPGLSRARKTNSMNDIARKALAEALATLLFVFTIITAVAAADNFAPVAIGMALMVLVLSLIHI